MEVFNWNLPRDGWSQASVILTNLKLEKPEGISFRIFQITKEQTRSFFLYL